MKIKKKLMLYLLAIVSIFILKVNDVYAAQKVKISLDYQSNIYFTRKGDGLNDSHQYLYYNLNGTPAFCIEPGVDINDWDYLVYGIEKSPDVEYLIPDVPIDKAIEDASYAINRSLWI